VIYPSTGLLYNPFVQPATTSISNGHASTGFRLGHRPALDGLRAIFILLVLTGHAGVPFMQGAALGVDGFFVLSGFLITCLLLQEWQQHGSISLKRFYTRRALRLLPALYVVLAVVSLITIFSLKGEGAVATGRGVLLSFFYSTNFVTAIYPDYDIGLGLMSHSWSLAVEEQFYLVWPILLIGLLSLRITGKKLAICTGLLILASPLWRFLLLSGGYSLANFYVGMNTRADALLTGCTLGVLASMGLVLPSERAARVTRWLLPLASIILAYLIVDPGWLRSLSGYYAVFPLVGLCAAVPILHLVVSPSGRLAQLLSWKPLVTLGVVSYGVYLWHNPVFLLFSTGSAGWLNIPMQLVRLVITAVVVFLSYRYIEKPMLRLKERFSGRPRIEPSPAAASGAYLPQHETA
jgi:peptidoglycan/LPS O-acetylase OafA/YrhL